MAKTLIIGIGGTGLSAIREIRMLIAEKYPEGLNSPEVAMVKFLYIDTDATDIPRRDWSVLGKDISLDRDEVAIISGDELGGIVQNQAQFPDIDCWLPEVRNFVGQPGPGAKGIRPYGRLIYEVNKNDIKNKIQSLYDRLVQNFQADPDWSFYLIGGLSGGTGSGMFIPLSFDLRTWNFYQGGQAARKFYSFLVLPPLQVPSGRHPRYHQNAYAALRELNYYNLQKGDSKLPYDNCYLLERRNRSLEIPLDNVPLLIAQRIFLNIQGGQAATSTASAMDNNIVLGNLGEDVRGFQHSRAFSSFGISSVSYPREVAAQCLSYKLSKKLVSSWIKSRNSPGNVNARLKEDLPNILLSFAYVIGDAVAFGKTIYKDYVIEIQDSVKGELDKLQPKQLAEKADSIRRDIEDGFRGLGIIGFYEQLKRDLVKKDKDGENTPDRAVEITVRQLTIKISSLIVDSEFGIDYAQAFLNELLITLDEFKTKIQEEMYSDVFSKRLKTFRQNLADAIARIAQDEKKLTYNVLGKEFPKNIKEINTELVRYLTYQTGMRAGEYGVKFLDQIIPRIGALSRDLNTWQATMKRSEDALSTSVTSILTDLASGTKENGKAVFNEVELATLESQINDSDMRPPVVQSIGKKLGQTGALDLLSLSDVPNPHVLVYRSVYEWVVNRVQFQNIQMYDKFVSGYTDPRDRQAILSEAESLSAPFVKFSPDEVNRMRIDTAPQTITTVPNQDGGANLDGRTNKQVILEDLERATGAALGQGALESPDNERIVFLKEIQGFPLRFIDLAGKLKESYDAFTQKYILHIDKRVEPSLYDLYLLSAEEELNQSQAEAAEIFVLARAYAWVLSKRNQSTNRDEIRYEFNDEKLQGLPTKLKLGEDWDVAFDSFVADTIKKEITDQQLRDARTRLTSESRKLRKSALTDEVIRRQIQQKLSEYLKQKLAESPLGNDDPQYERDNMIAVRIIKSLGV